MKNIVYLSVIIITVVSCTNVVPNKLEDSCEVMELIDHTYDTLPTYSLDLTEHDTLILDNIEKQFGGDICWNPIDFNYQFSKNEKVKLSVNKWCERELIVCYFKFPEVRIRLNRRGQVLINDSILNPTQISSWIEFNFPDSSNDNLAEFEINWQKQTPIDSLHAVFRGLKDGYSKIISNSSMIKHDKTLCKLSEIELNKLTMEIPFKLNLGL